MSLSLWDHQRPHCETGADTKRHGDRSGKMNAESCGRQGGCHAHGRSGVSTCQNQWIFRGLSYTRWKNKETEVGVQPPKAYTQCQQKFAKAKEARFGREVRPDLLRRYIYRMNMPTRLSNVLLLECSSRLLVMRQAVYTSSPCHTLTCPWLRLIELPTM